MSGVTSKNRRWAAAENCRRGYTLVELLVAICIFALVIASVYGAYKTTFSTIQGSEHQAVLADRSGFILARITDDLESMILGNRCFLLGEEHVATGMHSDTLAFVASSQIFLGKDDIPHGRLLIGYITEVDEKSGLLSLYRTETRVFPGVPIGDGGVAEKNLLCTGLKEIRFTYHDAVGNILTTWKSEGSDNEKDQEAVKIPVMVDVALVFPGIASEKSEQTFTTGIALPQQGDK